jgi:uncharacterized secreted repeat protein (TIGR03808 family)
MNVARRSILSAAALLAGGVPKFTSAKAIKINNLQGEIDKAIQDGSVLRLAAGTYATTGLRIDKPVQIEGVAGATIIQCTDAGPALVVANAETVSISGLTFTSKSVSNSDTNSGLALVTVSDVSRIIFENCAFLNSGLSGLRLERSGGRVVGNSFSQLGDTGVIAEDSRGLEISGNDVSNIGNSGILVLRSEAGEDGTQILNNRVSHIKANAGGNGPYGNGINVFRAGNVITSNNRISDCAFSAIRYNSASNCQILGNSISRAGETALYVEFAYQGAVVANNILDDVAFGITIANYDQGGRLAVVSGNLVRNAKQGTTVNAGPGHGIHADADTVVSNNVLENIESYAINLGWGKYCRNLTAQGNIIRNCQRGISFSTSEGAGKVLIVGNMIEGASLAAIQGMDYMESTTPDLSVAGAAAPANATINNNVVTG